MPGASDVPLVMHIATGGEEVGGISQHLWTLAPHLERSGFRVEVVVLGGGILLQQARERGIRASAVPKRGRGDLLAIARLSSLLRRRRPTLVHTHTLSTNFYGRFAALMAGVPRIVTTVHSFMGELRRYDPRGRLGNRLLFWQNQRMNRFADRLVAISAGVRQWLLDAGVPAHKIRLIRCGIDLGEAGGWASERKEARRLLGLGSDDWVIGNVARAHPVKDQAGLLEAAIPLLRGEPSAKLVIIGDGPERRRLQSRARSSGVEGQIVVAGELPNAREIMPAFDVFALSSRLEGIPLSLVEAMAAERPVVATRVGGVPELVVDGVSGLLVPPGSPEQLRAALARIRADGDLASRLGLAGRRTVEQTYDARRMGEATADMYRELLD